jgi:hypothetical protein
MIFVPGWLASCTEMVTISPKSLHDAVLRDAADDEEPKREESASAEVELASSLSRKRPGKEHKATAHRIPDIVRSRTALPRSRRPSQMSAWATRYLVAPTHHCTARTRACPVPRGATVPTAQEYRSQAAKQRRILADTKCLKDGSLHRRMAEAYESLAMAEDWLNGAVARPREEKNECPILD